MHCYIVTFELKDSSRRPGLEKALGAYNGNCPINENSWAIISEKKASEIRDLLKAKLGPADRLFVIRSGSEAAWLNSYGEKHNEWLKEYL